jgi:hypothetical protein
MMTAAAMMAHMTVTMAVSALHLHEVITGKDAGGYGRHRQCRCRRSEHCGGHKARFNKTFHLGISSTAQCGDEHKFPAWFLFQSRFVSWRR